MKGLRAFVVRILPTPVVMWLRRRRALKRYLGALSYEIYDRQIRLEIDDLDGRIAARRDGFYERMVKDVLERTELILQELDRRIEGLTARHGTELRELRAELEALQARLRDQPPADAPSPAPAASASAPAASGA